jgi:hypothetical protein
MSHPAADGNFFPAGASYAVMLNIRHDARPACHAGPTVIEALAADALPRAQRGIAFGRRSANMPRPHA